MDRVPQVQLGRGEFQCLQERVGITKQLHIDITNKKLNSRCTCPCHTNPLAANRSRLCTANSKGNHRVVGLVGAGHASPRTGPSQPENEQSFHIETADGEDASTIIHLFPEDQSALFDPLEMVK